MLGLMLTQQAHNRLSHPPFCLLTLMLRSKMYLPQWWTGYSRQEKAKDVTRIEEAALKIQAEDAKMQRSLSVRPDKVFPFVCFNVSTCVCMCMRVSDMCVGEGVYISWYASGSQSTASGSWFLLLALFRLHGSNSSSWAWVVKTTSALSSKPIL